MKLNYKYILLFITIVLFSGCAELNKLYTPTIASAEANKYIDSKMEEFEKFKKEYKSPYIIKWIQPNNKKEKCKIYMKKAKASEESISSEYKVFWDGKCKNGYAYGLGREIEKDILLDAESIVLYSGGKKEPKYFVYTNNLSKEKFEGNMKEGYGVITTLTYSENDINLIFKYGLFDNDKNFISKLIATTPFNKNTRYVKSYANIFLYRIDDLRLNEIERRSIEFNTINNKQQQHGYGFLDMKNNTKLEAEVINGQYERKVHLPKSYRNQINDIFFEIKNAGVLALKEQKKAIIVKNKYKKNICNSRKKIHFMSQEDYYRICNEEKEFKVIQKRIEEKLVKIKNLYNEKREQILQERLVQAREAEANAAIRQAKAVEDANFQKSIDSFNRNSQMQQMNNNLMMYNIMPKEHHLYIH